MHHQSRRGEGFVGQRMAVVILSHPAAPRAPAHLRAALHHLSCVMSERKKGGGSKLTPPDRGSLITTIFSGIDDVSSAYNRSWPVTYFPHNPLHTHTHTLYTLIACAASVSVPAPRRWIAPGWRAAAAGSPSDRSTRTCSQSLPRHWLHAHTYIYIYVCVKGNIQRVCVWGIPSGSLWSLSSMHWASFET